MHNKFTGHDTGIKITGETAKKTDKKLRLKIYHGVGSNLDCSD